jgi:hypothetical protein
MKKIIIAIIGLIIAMIFNSCNDAVDIGQVSKYAINPIDPNVKPVPTIFTLPQDSIIMNFRESYGITNTQYFWGKSINIIRNVIKIDTAKADPILYLDIEIQSNAPDKAMPGRSDRLVSFQLKLDDLTLKENIYLSFDYSPSNLLGVNIKNIQDQKTYYFSNKDLNYFSVVLFKGLNGTIICQLGIDGLSSLGFQTNSFTALFEIHYPLKKNI